MKSRRLIVAVASVCGALAVAAAFYAALAPRGPVALAFPRPDGICAMEPGAFHVRFTPGPTPSPAPQPDAYLLPCTSLRGTIARGELPPWWLSFTGGGNTFSTVVSARDGASPSFSTPDPCGQARRGMEGRLPAATLATFRFERLRLAGMDACRFEGTLANQHRHGTAFFTPSGSVIALLSSRPSEDILPRQVLASVVDQVTILDPDAPQPPNLLVIRTSSRGSQWSRPILFGIVILIATAGGYWQGRRYKRRQTVLGQ